MNERAYPPADWTATELADALAACEKSSPLPAYQDAPVWERFRSDPLTGPVVDRLLSAADRAIEAPIPTLPASGYVAYHEDGEYSNEDAEFRRRKRLSLFALAECLEREGRYRDEIIDYAWAICEQSTWLLPSHLPEAQTIEGFPTRVPPAKRGLALFSARAGQLLLEVDAVLGEELPQGVRTRIYEEVERRVLDPYLARNDLHWEGVGSNWNAVCTSSTLIAAMYLVSDPARMAPILRRGIQSLEKYLAGFDADGCTAEGLGYWNFGMSHYAMLVDHLDARTDGQYSLLTPAILQEIAAFPRRIQLSPGRFVAFSDADEAAWIEPFVACLLGERLDVPGLTTLGIEQFRDRQSILTLEKVGTFPEAIRNLVWCERTGAITDDPTPAPQTYFSGADWWLSRADPGDPDGLVLATKGGHNAEPHNHNDCGSFIVHYRGESLLTDLGRGAYHDDYFGDRRYEQLATRSLGHSVPYVNECEQAAGAEYQAEVVSLTEDAFELELADCYPPEAGVVSLRRRLRLKRTEPAHVSLVDRATFGEGAPRDFTSALVSYFPMEPADSGIVIRGDRGDLSVAGESSQEVSIEQLEAAIEPMGPSVAEARDVWRARFLAQQPAGQTAELRYEICPETDR